MTMTLDGTAGMTAPQGAVYNGLQTGTAVASTSGTSIDFTSIPVWARRVTIMFNGVSTNGTSNYLVQIGSGSIVSTGYNSASSYISSTTPATSTSTAGFLVNINGVSASGNYGSIIVNLVTGNTWCASGILGNPNGNTTTTTGALSLSGVLDRVRVTTVNGTDTFDAGTINIMYE